MTTTEALLEAVWVAGLIAVVHRGHVSLYKPNEWDDYTGESEGEGTGTTNEALSLALVAAERGKDLATT